MIVQTEAKKGGKFRSLEFTLAVAVLAIGMVMLIIVSLDLYFNIRAQQKVIDNHLQLVAKDSANKVESFINDKLSLLDAAVHLGNMADASQEEQKLLMNRLLGLDPAFRQLVLLNAQSQETARISRMSSAMTIELTEKTVSDIFSLVSEENTYIGPVYIDETTSEPMVIMAVPVTDIFGDFKGALVAEVNLKFMWDLVDSIKIGDSGLAYVVDMNGNLIAFGDTSRVLKGENLAYLDEVNKFMYGKELVHANQAEAANGIKNDHVLTTHVHLGTPDWAIVVELPVQEAYQSVTEVFRITSLMMLLGLLLVSMIGVYLSKRITKPIISLRDAAIKIGQGMLDTKIEVKSRGEIGELASAFNQMTIDLKQSQKEIKKHAQELGQRVQERTKDLDEKVTELTDTKTAVLNMMEDMDGVNKELIETQEELKESLKELKEMDVKKNQFISIAAHELKTPLTSIHGFSQLLQNRKVANNFTKRNKYLKIMDSETRRLSKLVGDMLDLSRIDLHTIKINLVEIDVSSLIKDIKREMDIAIKDKGLKSEYVVDSRMPKIVTDPERLTEILINLISNAIKYTPKGKITVNAFPENKSVHFVVKDTGIGIGKENHKKIFERFYQVDSSYTREAGGTGLGLALCKELVELLGGSIMLKSEKGKGSEFHFTLPLRATVKEQISKAEKRAMKELKKSEKATESFRKMAFGNTEKENSS